MDQYDRGALSRRQLVTRLLLLAGAPAVGLTAAEQQPAGAVAPALAYNHVHIGVSNHEKSAEFYRALVGAVVVGKGGGEYTAAKALWGADLPGSKRDLAAWISLDDGRKPGVIDHFAFSVDIPDVAAAKKLAADINKRFPFAEATPLGYADPEGKRPHRLAVSLKDPDGTKIALHVKHDSGWIPNKEPKMDF
jgi:catechol 2,3-dioxygenase-like lactoylglutathione lyase family enzyme